MARAPWLDCFAISRTCSPRRITDTINTKFPNKATASAASNLSPFSRRVISARQHAACTPRCRSASLARIGVGCSGCPVSFRVSAGFRQERSRARGSADLRSPSCLFGERSGRARSVCMPARGGSVLCRRALLGSPELHFPVALPGAEDLRDSSGCFSLWRLSGISRRACRRTASAQAACRSHVRRSRVRSSPVADPHRLSTVTSTIARIDPRRCRERPKPVADRCA